LGPGLGLGAFKLMRFANPASAGAGLLDPVLSRLLGRETLLAVTAGLGGGGGCARTVTVAGRTNMPEPMGQSK